MNAIHYPDLPIVGEKDKIIAALKTHSVIVIAGETGSGKTTQLPKICLEAGLGHERKIGHTQPRRLAARNVAWRVASELHVKLGELVGYKVRFSDQTSEQTRIQIMTDGILLSETQHDKNLLQYDCLIIDEAHERSLNIDFLLGYIKNLLKRRHDLKVIITSATIDVEKFSLFFDNAPLIMIPGRSYPIEVNYFDAADTDDLALHIAKTVKMACQRGPGDILIFQSGEKEIRELAEVLQGQHLAKVHILPVYARQTAKEQQKIFDRYAGRKIILATNVAETSLTVPNIRFVIDPGFARINRYNYRNKLQRLPIEPISQASAEQRKGRCGRVGPGICYRLYSEIDFRQRSLFTEPEILRINLAGVILRMLDLGFWPVQAFPLMDPLDPRYIKDGLSLLERLEAVDHTLHKKITKIGRQLARIPLEPKFGRILLGAVQYGCLKEILIIVSALSIIDPREYPQEQREKVDLIYAQFKDERSDFLFYFSLWNFLFSHKKTLSHQKFRLLCRQNYLSYLRVCEWFDVHQQLEEIVKEFSFKVNEVDADYSLVHRAILTGLLDSIGMKDEKRMYIGARNVNFYIHPGSALFKKTPQWVMACEIVHTSRTYARINARIEPEWIEEVGKKLLKRQVYEPHYDPKEGRVVAFEKVVLLGLTLADKRKVSYEKTNFQEAREIFIREALCEEKLRQIFPFYEKNKKTTRALQSIEERIRKQGVLFSEENIFNFYDRQLPQTIASVSALSQWLKNESQDFLIFSKREVKKMFDLEKVEKDFPIEILLHGTTYKLEYLLDLASEYDGATLIVPIEILKNIKENDFSWPIPGWLSEKIDYAIRALPKKIRLQINLIPKEIKSIGTFAFSLSEALRAQCGLIIEPSVFEAIQYPSYLCLHFKIVNVKEEEIARGDSLLVLYEALKNEYRNVFLTGHVLEKNEVLRWDFGDLPSEVIVQKGQGSFRQYPALVAEAEQIRIQLCESMEIAEYYHANGLTRLALLHLSESVKYFKKEMCKQKKQFEKYYSPFGTVEEGLEAILFLAAFETFTQPYLPKDQAEFLNRIERNKALFLKTAMEIAVEVIKILEMFALLQKKMQLLEKKSLYQPVIREIDIQLKQLLPKDFIMRTPQTWLFRLLTYLKAIDVRLDKYPTRILRDQQWEKDLLLLEKAYFKRLNALDRRYRSNRDPIYLFRFSLEELRVSLFAESLKTIGSVSTIRLLKLLEKLR